MTDEKESVATGTAAEALKGIPSDRVDEIARAIHREPLKYIAISAAVGLVVA